MRQPNERHPKNPPPSLPHKGGGGRKAVRKAGGEFGCVLIGCILLVQAILAGPAAANLSSGSITSLVISNQAAMPGEAFRWGTITLNNSSGTNPVTVTDIQFTLTSVNNVAAGEVYTFVITDANNTTNNGSNTRSGPGNVTVTLVGGNTIPVNGSLTLGSWIYVAGLADQDDQFTITAVDVNWTGGTSGGGNSVFAANATNTVSVAFTIDGLTDGQVPDIAGANSEFSLVGLNAAGTGQIDSVTVVFQRLVGDFQPYWDFEWVRLYRDANGNGSFDFGTDTFIQEFDRDGTRYLCGHPTLSTPLDASQSCTMIFQLSGSATRDLPTTYAGNASGNNNYFVAVKTGGGWDTGLVGYGDEWICTIPPTGVGFKIPNVFANPPGSNDDSAVIGPSAQVAPSNNQGGQIKEVMETPRSLTPGSLTGALERNVDAFFGSPVSLMTDLTSLDFNPTLVFAMRIIGGPTDGNHLATTMDGLVIQFPASQGFDPRTDLRPITGDQFSGISIWENNSGDGGLTFSQGADVLLPLSPAQTVWGPGATSCTIFLQNGYTLRSTKTMDVDGTPPPADYSFWVAILTSKTIDFEDTFHLGIPDRGVIFGHGKSVRPAVTSGSGTVGSYRQQVLTFLSDVTLS